MKYSTINGFEQFNFSEAYISAVQKVGSYFQLTLNNVTILPDNPCNRDVREMRTNGLNLKIQEGSVVRLIQEGYKVYNAEGKLTEQYEDKQIELQEYNVVLKALADGESSIYSVEKNGNMYSFAIDASDERTYFMQVSGTRDIEEWDRFLTK